MSTLLLKILLGTALTLYGLTAALPSFYGESHDELKRFLPDMDICDNYCMFLTTVRLCIMQNAPDDSDGTGPRDKTQDELVEMFDQVCGISGAVINCVLERTTGNCSIAVAERRGQWITQQRDFFCDGERTNSKFRTFIETKLSSIVSTSNVCTRAIYPNLRACSASLGIPSLSTVCMAPSEEDGAIRFQKLLFKMLRCSIEAALNEPQCSKQDISAMFSVQTFLRVPGGAL